MYSSTRDYEASVLVRGRPVTEVNHNGRTYIEGRSGSTFELKFRNNTNRRVKVVTCVDGLSVINGKLCGMESPGYIVAPYSSVTIPGWKIDGHSAAEFMFTPQGSKGKSQTYSEALGISEENQGTIGFMVFPEKRKSSSFAHGYQNHPGWGKRSSPNDPRPYFPKSDPWKPDPWNPYPGNGPIWTFGNSNVTKGMASDSITAGAASTGSMSASGHAGSDDAEEPVSASLGTGWGNEVGFETVTVDFEAEDRNNPDAVFVIYYDTIQNLKKAGVPVEQLRNHYSSSYQGPNPFPASPEVMQPGCPVPGWWNRK